MYLLSRSEKIAGACPARELFYRVQGTLLRHKWRNMAERILWLFVAIFLLAACEASKLPSPFHAGDVTAKFSQADFHLNDQHGQVRTLADFRGKVGVLFFGYTQCPDVCPTTMASLSRMMDLLGKDADKVQVLFVTVDPERDKPAVLAEYMSVFNPAFLALTGDAQSTGQIVSAFNITYKKHPTTSGYAMDHSDGIFIIDPKGKVRLLAPYPQRSEWMAEDIRLLLAGV